MHDKSIETQSLPWFLKLDGYTIYIAYSQIIEQIFQGFSQLWLVHGNIILPKSMHDKSIETQPLPWFFKLDGYTIWLAHS